MNNAPILILQMQRMGDLVLSFPLLSWLGRQFQGHPIWVVGEKAFFDPLLPLSPQVTYFSYEGTPDIAGLNFHAVINLSHRPEAAALAGKAKTDTLIGPYLDAEGRLLIRGDWQLYRASLTHNNRYNRFHWADLNALDIVPSSLMLRTNWPLPRSLPGLAAPQDGTGASPAAVPLTGGRIGLFLGASEPEKHPDVAFWITLTRQLLRAGHKPVLLGGPAEKDLGRAVASGLNAHPLNLCGHFTVGALAHFISELDLFITPDTGPMHIAAWTGTPTLNISLGPVNPWETGPFSPGHHVVRASLDCVGCWRCTQKTVECKEQMVAGRVAAIAETLLGSRPGELASLGRVARGLELLRTARGAYGLYRLDPVFAGSPFGQGGARQPDAGVSSGVSFDAAASGSSVGESGSGEFFESAAVRQDVAIFWQAWFGVLFGRFTQEQRATAWKNLSDRHPAAARQIQAGKASLALILARAMKKDVSLVLGNVDMWETVPPLLRPLSGYIQMYVQNALGTRASFAHALDLVEQVVVE